jgi:hypothetical protein
MRIIRARHRLVDTFRYFWNSSEKRCHQFTIIEPIVAWFANHFTETASALGRLIGADKFESSK